METRTYNVYTFEELSKDAKAKVIENNRLINIEGDGWSDFVLEDWYTVLKLNGYHDAKIMFSGFGSQGDGACFTATIDIGEWLAKHHQKSDYRALLECYDRGYVVAHITHNERYFFSTSTTVDIYIETIAPIDEKIDRLIAIAEAQAEGLVKMIEDDRKILGNKIYKALGEAYNELTSDASVAETLEVNEYLFDEDGTIDS